MHVSEFDYVLVGGGLQSALIILALRDRRPDARIALVERDASLGGNHTWCYHEKDVSADAGRWIRPLAERSWSTHDVRFPGLNRTISCGYTALGSQRMHEVISDALSGDRHEVYLGCEAESIQRERVVLADGRALGGKLVIDARGPQPEPDPSAGYQKFVGHELEFARPHGIERPVLMDATVDQTDGFRFFYLLPFTDTRMLVEDTRFTSAPELAVDEYRAGIEQYREQYGWGPAELIREETGVLPMPWAGSVTGFEDGVLVAGYRGGWFHPGTGYSLPVAARLAETVAAHPPEEVRGPIDGLRTEIRRQRRFCHFLNRLLFRWYPPEMRRHVFARFYRLPEARIERFYSLRLNHADRYRLVVGRPPRGLSLRYRVTAGDPS